MKKRFSEVQIIGFLREAEAGIAVNDLCRRHGFSEASYYLWRSKFGGMTVPDDRRGRSATWGVRAVHLSMEATVWTDGRGRCPRIAALAAGEYPAEEITG